MMDKFFAWSFFIAGLFYIGLGIYEQSWEQALNSAPCFVIVTLYLRIFQQNKLIESQKEYIKVID